MTHRRISNVARLPDPPIVLTQDWARRLVNALQQKHDLDARPLITGYTVTNATESRSLDASAATLAELRNFVGTLVNDLIDAGFIGS